MRCRVGLRLSLFLGACALYTGYHSHHVYSDEGSALLPVLTMLVLYLPAAGATVRWLGGGLAMRLLGALAVAAVVLESVAVLTGVPYGEFSYGDGLGPKILGVTPWTVGLVWPVLVLGALAVASRMNRRPSLLALSIALFVVFDLVIDPGAVALGLWAWSSPGAYFGVPLSNYLGWAVAGGLGALVIVAVLGPDRSRFQKIPSQLALAALLHILFFAAVCLAHDRFAPSILGLSVVAASAIALTLRRSTVEIPPRLQPGHQRSQ